MVKPEKVSLKNKEYRDYIYKVLTTYMKELKNRNLKVFLLSLIGSQNYDLASIDSDVDALAIIFPAFQNLYLNQEVSCKEIRMPTGIIKLMDVRSFFKKYFNGNFTCFEIFNTSMKVFNKDYSSLYFQAEMKQNQIFYQQYPQIYKSILGMMSNCYYKGKTYKTISRIFYLYNFLNSINCGETLKDSYTSFSTFSFEEIYLYKNKKEIFNRENLEDFENIIKKAKEDFKPDNFYHLNKILNQRKESYAFYNINKKYDINKEVDAFLKELFTLYLKEEQII